MHRGLSLTRWMSARRIARYRIRNACIQVVFVSLIALKRVVVPNRKLMLPEYGILQPAIAFGLATLTASGLLLVTLDLTPAALWAA